MSSPKEGTVGEEQHKAEPISKEGWTPLKPEEVSTTAQCLSASHEVIHRRQRQIPLKKKKDHTSIG
jgi:hypothetical protein